MNLQEGETVYCLIKTHAITYISELDSPSYQRVITHNGGHYFFDVSKTDQLGKLFSVRTAQWQYY